MRNRTDFGAKHCCAVCFKYFICKVLRYNRNTVCQASVELLHTLIKYINCI